MKNLLKRTKLELINELKEIKKANVNLQQKIANSVTGFTELTEGISTAVFIYQGDNFVYFNSAAKETFGYSEEEFYKIKFWDLVHPDFRQLVKERGIARQQGEHVPLNYEFKIITKNGNEKWLDYTAGNTYWKGKPAVIGSAFDITSRKNTEQELLKFKLCIQGSFEATFITDIHGTIIFANPAFETIYGYNQAEVIGNTPRILKSGTLSPEVYKNFWDTLLSKKAVAGEIINKTKNGKLISVEGFNTSILDADGNIFGFIGIHRDITEQKKSEDAIKLFKTLIDQSNDAIEVVDAKTGRFVNVNERGLIDLGYSREEFLKLSVWDVDPMVDESIFAKIVEQLKIAGTRLWEGRHKRNDGTTFPVEVNIKIVSLDKDYLVTVVRDITERKQTEELVQKLSRAVEQSPVSIIITNKEGNIEYINPKVTETSGFQAQEVIGSNPRIFSSGEKTKEEYKLLWERINSGKDWFGEFHNRKKNGELYWESGSISPIKNQVGEITHFVAIKEDISELKRTIDELTAAKEKATESDRLKSAFLATMSHELRTPLNAIIGFSEMFNENLNTEEVKEYGAIVHSSGNQLLGIVEDIFDITLIEAGNIHISMEDVLLKSLIAKVQENLKIDQLRMNKQNINVQYDNSLSESLVIHTDFSKLKQILTNLIKNALKFTQSGSINYGYTLINTEANPIIQFYVKDTGIGIPQEKMEIIFEMFRQVEDSNIRKFGGTGIGLSITKKLVELLGGSIWVESTVGEGTTFYFTLPKDIQL